MSVVTTACATRRARLALVAALVASSMVVAACAGWPDGGGSRPSGPTRSPVTLAPGVPPPGGAGAAGAAAGTRAGGASPSSPTEPGSMTWVCADVARRYADLVAGSLGLADDGGSGPVVTTTAAPSPPMPASLAHDLDVLAQAYGGAARAVDAVGAAGGASLDQAITSVTAPAVTGAARDLVRFLRGHCS